MERPEGHFSHLRAILEDIMSSNVELIVTIKNILAKELNINSLDVLNESTSLRDDLGLDSMATLTFLMSLEDNVDNFTIDANTLEGHHVETIGTICNYVNARLEETA
ncbi:acyl carrier protein [Xenorhabdus mauleonii]|uniref:Acyl carrier protein n=2 Tax=Xenorhabdus mauleonii TaxID=351675 RepID=A0A1I3S6P1_9GAMM|nr:acyl carrier protein [Xenorhabdus mauleonii]SFJ54484.1 acyl carrier protein [Xenorhabdus mauleonii]